ncbi:hypothetical protein [Undibacterium sp. TS12]|uniref:hypothetical protein n=1 Tax=Undibacterium sp. TS12 TaxID=2908202 RepID=UPI001F4C6202|nr:hypothetical protein [Undibacterium sp. TS12]MCH8622208.1 hypothetical protein [Undibacterium sp. TS12]
MLICSVYLFCLLSGYMTLPALAQAPDIPADIPADVSAEKRAFTTQVEKQLRQKLDGVSIRTEEAPLILTLDSYRISLDRLYQLCRQDASKCTAQLGHFINAVADTVNTKAAEARKKDLRLTLRSSLYMSQLGPAATYLQQRSFLDGFTVLVVSDAGGSMRPVNSADLAGFNMSAADLYALASSNTQAVLPPMAEVARPAMAGKIETTGFDPYAASRLLYFNDWAELAKAQNGVLLVCAPSASRLLYISESNPKAISKLRETARDFMSGSVYPLSEAILKWTPGGWEVLFD